MEREKKDLFQYFGGVGIVYRYSGKYLAGIQWDKNRVIDGFHLKAWRNDAIVYKLNAYNF